MRVFLQIFGIVAGLILVYLLLSQPSTNGIIGTLSSFSINFTKALQGR